MNINLTDLFQNGFFEIDDNLEFSLDEVKKAGMLDLRNLRVKGEVFYKKASDEVECNIIIKGVMVLPCAVSLKPVNYDFTAEIEENLTELVQKNAKFSENNQKTIDILPILWENILMEIPIRVVSDEAFDIKTKGDGWELITDDKQDNPSLAKLKDLL